LKGEDLTTYRVETQQGYEETMKNRVSEILKPICALGYSQGQNPSLQSDFLGNSIPHSFTRFWQNFFPASYET